MLSSQRCDLYRFKRVLAIDHQCFCSCFEQKDSTCVASLLPPPSPFSAFCIFFLILSWSFICNRLNSRRWRVSLIQMFSERPLANRGLASAREAARQRLQQRLRCAAADCLAKHFFGLRESSAFSESCKSFPHGHDSSSRCTVSPNGAIIEKTLTPLSCAE